MNAKERYYISVTENTGVYSISSSFSCGINEVFEVVTAWVEGRESYSHYIIYEN